MAPWFKLLTAQPAPAAPIIGCVLLTSASTCSPRGSLRFAQLIQVYCERKSLDPKAHRFHFDGKRINDTLSVGELGFEDGDEITVSQEQAREHVMSVVECVAVLAAAAAKKRRC